MVECLRRAARRGIARRGNRSDGPVRPTKEATNDQDETSARGRARRRQREGGEPEPGARRTQRGGGERLWRRRAGGRGGGQRREQFLLRSRLLRAGLCL